MHQELYKQRGFYNLGKIKTAALWRQRQADLWISDQPDISVHWSTQWSPEQPGLHIKTLSQIKTNQPTKPSRKPDHLAQPLLSTNNRICNSHLINNTRQSWQSQSICRDNRVGRWETWTYCDTVEHWPNQSKNCPYQTDRNMHKCMLILSLPPPSCFFN